MLYHLRGSHNLSTGTKPLGGCLTMYPLFSPCWYKNWYKYLRLIHAYYRQPLAAVPKEGWSGRHLWFTQAAASIYTPAVGTHFLLLAVVAFVFLLAACSRTSNSMTSDEVIYLVQEFLDEKTTIVRSVDTLQRKIITTEYNCRDRVLSFNGEWIVVINSDGTWALTLKAKGKYPNETERAVIQGSWKVLPGNKVLTTFGAC